MIRISFPDSAPRDAAVFAQMLQQDLRREGVTESNMAVVKESDEAMSGGWALLVGAVDQIPQLVDVARALAATAKGPALEAFQWVEHIHTAHWLIVAIVPKLFEISHKFKIKIRIDTAHGPVDVDAHKSTLEETKAEIERLNDHGDGGGN
jgi:hypothetical protein